MTRTLLWDTGLGEVRAGLVEQGRLTEFRLIRSRRDKALYAAGEIYTARIVERLSAKSALVTLGGETDALLQPAPDLPEGAIVAVQMTRAPVPEPGRWKRAIVRLASDVIPQPHPGWHTSAEPWQLFLRAAKVDAIICSDARAANDVRSALSDSPPIHIDAARIAEADFEGLIDAAVSGEFAIEGGTLSFERTRAMTLIDIDGGGDPMALNLSAAHEIPRLLRMLDVGGQIGIDFLALPDRKARLTVDAALADACLALGPHERTAINGFGFAQVVRPRQGPSVSEILCGIAPGRLSAESKAIALLRNAAHSHGFGRRQLIAPPAIIELLRGWNEEVGALRLALGADIELVSDSGVTGYGIVHVAQS